MLVYLKGFYVTLFVVDCPTVLQRLYDDSDALVPYTVISQKNLLKNFFCVRTSIQYPVARWLY